MAEFGECGESDYTMITLADLFDLRYSRIIVAQIGRIYPETNSARISIHRFDACPELEGKDLSAVPFFYHCEDSTGTVEDLERGFMAFEEGDAVLVLYSPENGDVEDRFFIIGHANIRTLEKCAIDEYLYIRTRGIWGLEEFYCIFDPVKGELLDIEAFENIDEESPEKPSAAMGKFTVNLQNWLNYNFKYAESWPIVPYEFSLINDGAVSGKGVVVAEEERPYTGTGGFISSYWGSNPPPEDFPGDWWNPGNGEYYYFELEEHTGTEGVPHPELVLVDGTSSYEAHNTQTSYCLELDETGGAAIQYFGSMTEEWDVTSRVKPGAEIGLKLTDTVLGTEFKGLLNFNSHMNIGRTYTTSCGEIYGQFVVERDDFWTEQYETSWDFSALNGGAGKITLTGDREFGNVRVHYTEVSHYYRGNYVGIERGKPPQVVRNDTPVHIGRLGFYFISGSVFYAGHATAINDELVYGPDVVYFTPCAVVSLFDKTVRKGDTVTLSQCIANANQESSVALANTVQQLYQMTYDYLLGNSIEIEVLDYFEMVRNNGLTVSVITRKKR